ncbi:uncharacterized protein LOC106068687 [Biomphalaria glabrata]|uniref:Uncharacterized protein LOC106068687 n=1 Tax=Biomphalaria glabrata TaxID=6526 RepID=A0A9W3AV19_BIOGL|nr:uncharacterized protein LOC106068687 [Biomphalaria glabrata]
MSTRKLSNKVFALPASHQTYNLSPSDHSQCSTYKGFPSRASTFISTFKQNQRISFTREWFYEEMAVVPTMDMSLGSNVPKRQCLLRPLNYASDPCPVCEHVFRYRDRIVDPRPSWTSAKSKITRPLTVPPNSDGEMKKCHQNCALHPRMHDVEDSRQYMLRSATSNKNSSTKESKKDDGYEKDDRAQDEERDTKSGCVVLSSSSGSGEEKEEHKETSDSLQILAERLDYVRKTNQVLKYYMARDDDGLVLPSLRDIEIPTSSSCMKESYLR